MSRAVRVRLVWGAALAAVSLGGCWSGASGAVAARAAEDAHRVRDDVATRIGAEVPAPSADVGDGAADPASDPVAALLASPLTEETAVKIALLRNGSVREAYESLGIARADLLQAGLISNPVFSVSSKFFSAGPEVELGIAQSFVDLFFAPLRRRVAEADLCAAQAAVARDLVRLVFDVRRAFATLRAAQDLVETRKAAQRSADASVDLIKRLHDAGNVVDARLTVEEVGASRAYLALSVAEAAARDAREPLNVLLGLSGSSVGWKVEGALPELPRDFPNAAVAQARALASSLDLVESRARVESAARQAGLVRGEGATPHLDLGVVGKRESGGAFGAGPQVSTALPIFDWGQAKSAVACAVARQRVAHHAALAVEVASAARRLSDRWSDLLLRDVYLRQTYLPLRARLVVETLQAYNAMQIGAFEVLDSKQAEVDAQRESLETRRDAWLARLDLDELFAGSLNPPRLAATAPPAAAEPASGSKGH